MLRRAHPGNACAAVALALCGGPTAFALDVSAPALIQWFEASYNTVERRLPDAFHAGYGGMWFPPPGRADLGDFSVGYDVYDRFDLGRPGRHTLYGTATGLRSTVRQTQRAGMSFYVDFVLNHNGFSNLGTVDGNGNAFAEAGGYPGFVLTQPGATDGDFHTAFPPAGPEYEFQFRLSNLVDIDQRTNFQYVRHPVPGFANNIPAGVTPAFGRIANVPAESNRAFYPDRDLPPILLNDPATGQFSIPVYPYNSADPTAGDPVAENATGLLMRYAQWMVQHVGVDGFRVDAARHVYPWVHNFHDRAVYRSDRRAFLDGSPRHVFSFLESYTGDRDYLQTFIRKDINPAAPDTVGGNRDVLDFPLFFAMRDNLTENGLSNDWRNVVNASQDVRDDGLANNGSQAVAFVISHDDGGPALSNVAHAYMLMRPGNAIVYHNARQFGEGRDFPKDGRGDALGGFYGDRVTTLVNLRNTHGRGDYLDRTPSSDRKEMLIYERENSALVVLSNRSDGGFDQRTVATGFAPGTPLIELTGNAADAVFDPFSDFPELLVVNGDGTVNLRVPRNRAPGAAGAQHNSGYLIYGVSGPQGTLALSNVASVLAGGTPTAATNGTTRLADLEVISAPSFDVALQTVPVTLLGVHRDADADGDNALLKFNDGIDVNGSGTVDFRTPGDVVYGFEQFTTVRSPLVGGGTGQYRQTVDTATLPEGVNYLAVRAFRHRSDGGPPVFTDFRKAIYVDRLDPLSGVHETLSFGGNNRDVIARSLDQTADSVHMFLNLPASMTDAQILSMVGGGNRASVWDRDLFKYGFFNVPNGNNAVTLVTYEPTGNVAVQRIAGIDMGTTRGAGLGDLNFDGVFAVGDVFGTAYGFEAVLYPNFAGVENHAFNPAADLDANGRIDNRDLYALPAHYASAGAAAAVIEEAGRALRRRGDMNLNGATDAADIDALYQQFGNAAWRYDLDVSGGGADQGDVDTLVRLILGTQYGDANLDGRVDVGDLGALASGWQSPAAGWAAGDFTGDRAVTVADLGLVATYWQFGVPGPAAPFASFGLAAVPEPALAGLLGLLLLAGRRLSRTLSDSYHAPRASRPFSIRGVS